MPRKKSFNSDDVLQKILIAFWEKGYDATSLSDIEKATGVHRKSLYNEFGDKNHLFEIALKRYTNQIGVPLAEQLKKLPLGLQNIKDFFSLINSDSEPQGCLLTMTINHKELIDKKVFKVAESAVFQTEKLFYMNLFEAFKSRKKAKVLSEFLTSSMQGIMTIIKLDPNPKRLKNVIQTIINVLETET